VVVPRPPPLKGTVREIAGAATGVSGTTVHRAMAVKEAAPEAFEAIKRGETTVLEEYRKLPVKQGKERANGKRQQQIEAAHKRHMIAALAGIEGHCLGLADINVDFIRSVCTEEEIKTWAGSARELCGKLRRFANSIQGVKHGDEKTEGKKDENSREGSDHPSGCSTGNNTVQTQKAHCGA
jgi:hypothetical protein